VNQSVSTPPSPLPHFILPPLPSSSSSSSPPLPHHLLFSLLLGSRRVAVGIRGGPLPQVGAHRLKVATGGPAKLCSGFGGVGVADGDVAWENECGGGGDGRWWMW
jgi:hypothetical protein